MQLVVRAAASKARQKQPLAKQLEAEIRSEACALSLQNVNGLLQALWEKKEAMEHAQAEASLQLLLQFLHHARCVCMGPVGSCSPAPCLYTEHALAAMHCGMQ